MASSDDEAGPSNKRLKLVTTKPLMDVRDMNELFPKIDNLEHFPLKVLMNIFKRLDYMDLYNLAEKSVRFEKIAKIVLNERYAHEYFIVDDDKHKKETYIDFFERFGTEIKSLCAKGIRMRSSMAQDENHWITSVLDKAKNLEKLEICQCSTEKTNKHLLHRHVNENITHLTLNHVGGTYTDFVLSKFKNLKKLKIENDSFCYHPFFGPSSNAFNTLNEVIRNNPALESLIIDDKIDVKLYPFDRLMKLIGTHSNQLKEFAYVTEEEFDSNSINQLHRQPDHIVDSFVNSLKHVESLELSKSIHSFTDFMALLVRLNSQCPNIKHLKLYDLDEDDTELIKFIERLESLELSFINFDYKDEIESLVEHLPFLHYFKFEVLNGVIDWTSFVLILIRKCPSLQTITVNSKAEQRDRKFELFGTTKFFNQFIESVQNRNVKIQIEDYSNVIGSVTKDEVIWREKLLHWKADRDPSKNLSNVHLLDLAEPIPNAASNVDQRNAFNLILDYLDLKSLCSLWNTNKKCSQLVGDFMQQHSQQNGTFTVTNEFSHMENTYYDGLEIFADYVINLRVNIIHGNADGLKKIFEKFHKLNKLYMNIDFFINGIKARDLIVPQVRHLISYNEFFKFSSLYKLSCVCPDLETFETDRPFSSGHKQVKSLNFRELKKITFKTHTFQKIEVVNKLKALVEHMGTELCFKEF